jgi:ribose/xylose/arabinose/galactoside ABC-type transport system permease subunit
MFQVTKPMKVESSDTQQLAETRAPSGRTLISVGSAFLRARQAGILLALLITWIVLSLASPYFLTATNISNLALQASVIGITAAGATLVILCGEIDVSVGAMEALSGSVAAYTTIKAGLPLAVGILAALVVGALVGFINGGLVTRLGLPSFIVTLGMLGIAQGSALVLTGGTAIYGFPNSFQVIGQGKVGGIPVPVMIAITVYLLLWATLRFTRFGFNIYAVGGNTEAARLSGVRPGRVKLAAFMISGLCATLAGLILAARLDAGAGNFGTADLLNAIAAIVIGGASLFGGVGSVVGTAIGILLIGTITNGLDLLNVSTFWQQITIGILIIGAITLDRLTKGTRR